MAQDEVGECSGVVGIAATYGVLPEKGSMKIATCHISAMPKNMFDKMPEVTVVFEDGTRKTLFDYYPDEISFSESEFIGLTEPEARNLKFRKDKAFLQS